MPMYTQDQFWALKEVLSKKRPERSPVARRCLEYVTSNLVDRAPTLYQWQRDLGEWAKEISGRVSQGEQVNHAELNVWRCVLIERIVLLTFTNRWKEARSLLPTLEWVMYPQ